MTKRLCGACSGRTFEVDTDSSKIGGQGTVHTTADGRFVVKLYSDCGQDVMGHISYMVAHPPSGALMQNLAWPLDMLTENGRFVGILMNNLGTFKALNEVCVTNMFRDISTKKRVWIAHNLASMVNDVHACGMVIGDFNPRNIGVRLDTGRVVLFDTDSMLLSSEGARSKLSNVGMPDYRAPEVYRSLLAQQPRGTFDHPYTRSTDLFDLAIHIFRLLMSVHPYDSKKEGQTKTNSHGADEDKIALGEYSFREGYVPFSRVVPPKEFLDDTLQGLFQRAFVQGTVDPGARPSAKEWMWALERYHPRLVTCPDICEHMYPDNFHYCPLCEMEAQMMIVESALKRRPTKERIEYTNGTFTVI